MTVYKFRFNYIGNRTTAQISDGYGHEGFHELPDGKMEYIEYDGRTVTAPDEESAWDIFLNSDGVFKCPDYANYNIQRIEALYEFEGDTEKWKEAVAVGEVE